MLAGRRLTATLALGDRGALRPASGRTGGALYPVKIDPLIQLGAKLTPNDGSGVPSPAVPGTSVALSADGSTVLIGGPGDSSIGAAWVFTETGGVWTQQGRELRPPSDPVGHSLSSAPAWRCPRMAASR